MCERVHTSVSQKKNIEQSRSLVRRHTLMSPPDSFTTPQMAITGTFVAYW